MRKRVMQIMGVVCLVLALALTQVPASMVEAVSSAADFEQKENKLVSYTGTAEAVSVPAGIKTIGEDAFAGNRHIKSVCIPSSVEVIENGAFRDCDSLETVILSSGLVEIGSGAFSLCEKLNSFQLSDTVLHIGAGVFAGDSRLKGIEIGRNPYFTCENGVLYDRDKETLIQYFSSNRAEEFIMPDSVKEIERYSFWGCRNLEQVKLSPYLYSIPEFAFANCRDLKTVDIPFSVRKIDAKAFEDCVRLKTVSIPVSVTQIHATAFDGCPGIFMKAEEGTFAKAYYEELKDKQTEAALGNDNLSKDPAIGLLYGQTIQQSLSGNELQTDPSLENETEDKSNEADESGLYNPNKPSDVSKLNVSDYYAQDGEQVLGKTRVVANEAVILPVGENAFGTDIVQNEEEEILSYDMILPDEENHIIPKKKYYEDTSLTTVTLENTITELGDFSFARSNMRAICLPEGVTKIGYGCFYHCDRLATIIVPETVTEIMPQAFEETAFLTNWEKDPMGSDFLVVGDGILIGYKGEGGCVTIPGNVKKIAGGVFRDCTDIYQVNFSESLVEIGEEAFAGCSSLSSLTGLGHVQKIADRAFSRCPLKQLHLGNDVQYIGLGAYTNTLADAVVFESVKQLPVLSFEQTATRYDNVSYREAPFGSISVAVIDDSVDLFDDTVLDEDCLGFRGVVVSLPNGKNAENKVARLEYCTLLPQEGQVNVKVPSSVSVDGILYTITSADANAFSPYTRLKSWSDAQVEAILLPDNLGQIQDYEPNLFSAQENAKDEETQDGGSSELNDLDGGNEVSEKEEELIKAVNVNSTYPQAEMICAEVMDDTETYMLYVTRSDEEYDLQDKVSECYGEVVEGQLSTFDLKLVEKKTNIPITILDQNRVKVTVPISQTLYEQDICALSLDAQKELTVHYGTKSEQDGSYYFTFTTNHFSPYGIYAGIGTQAKIIREKSKAIQSLDDSPDTGERINPFLILAIAFGCVGAALFLGGFGKRIRVK